MIKNTVFLLRLGEIINIFHNLNDFKSDFNNIKYLMKSSEITNPNKIISKFIDNYDSTWTLYDLINDYDKIDGISFDQMAKFAYIIDKNHELEITQKNIHYIKLIPDLIELIIKNLDKHNIIYDVL